MGIVRFDKIEDKIIELRGEKVIIDSEVADLYGVETKRINEAVKNNTVRFPDGYIIEITKDEFDNLRSKFSTSSWGGRRHLPKAFTEKGLYMLATILTSKQAIQTTIAIIETYYRIKTLSRTIKDISTIQDKEKQQSLMQKSGDIIAEILGDDLVTDGSETTFELNLAVLKFKHTIKKKKC